MERTGGKEDDAGEGAEVVGAPEGGAVEGEGEGEIGLAP